MRAYDGSTQNLSIAIICYSVRLCPLIGCELIGELAHASAPSQVAAMMTQATESSEKLTEIGALLAAALLRLRDRKSSQNSADYRNNQLDFEASSTGHVAKNLRKMRP